MMAERFQPPLRGNSGSSLGFNTQANKTAGSMLRLLQQNKHVFICFVQFLTVESRESV